MLYIVPLSGYNYFWHSWSRLGGHNALCACTGMYHDINPPRPLHIVEKISKKKQAHVVTTAVRWHCTRVTGMKSVPRPTRRNTHRYR